MNDNPTPPPEHSRWKPGQSGNPGGRPVRARVKLQGAFVNALAADFEVHGKKAIEECRDQDPGRYLSIVASLMPKQIEKEAPALEELTDAELVAGIALLRASLTVRDGTGGTETPSSQEPSGVH